MSYTPDNEPTTDELKILISIIWNELRKIATEIEQMHDHEILYAEPPKLYNGMVRYADGTEWDPIGDGSIGFVGYENGSWVKL